MFSSGLNVEPLVDAVRDGRPDINVVAHEVGASAAQLGVPLHEVLDHVERAYAPAEPPFAVTRTTAVAWAERVLVDAAGISCEDPLTSLASAAYLRSRLAELYRGAEREGRRAADTHALVVVELSRACAGHELELALRALDVAQALRTVFAGDETVAQLSTRRFAALASRERADDLTITLLGLVLERTLGDGEASRLWVEHLPGSTDGIAAVLAALGE